MTIPFHPSFSAKSIESEIAFPIFSDIELLFELNSTHKTPSPISITLHSEFFNTILFS